MANPTELTRDGHNMSPTVDEPSPPLPPAGAKSMSIAALDAAIEHEIRMGTLDPNMDKKQMRRIISNRYAAKKAHDRKVNKMVGLENNQKDLEDTIATLRPKIEHEHQLKAHLSLEKAMLVQRLQIYTDLNNLKEAEVYKNTLEREWLMEIFRMQQPSPSYN
ncbi:hypothetical protein L1987_22183 [Smallanthus sonchifolius]|uniref:Uncharacterized protein n=1 Tax=Smallanthus sonchifolius TaxID=185202 RepID=A0ACB9IEB8_9ASTR|nr:hypothetical protein L1987_22183 [Smallanthus sonchifolius]